MIFETIHPSFKTSEKLRNWVGKPYSRKLENLLKLGRGLVLNPPLRKKFDMGVFIDENKTEESQNALKELRNPECGAVGCAVGYAPFYLSGGRFPRSCVEETVGESYSHYYRSYLIDNLSLFGGYWEDIDNTPEGAGNRILMFLSHGEDLVDWYEKKLGVCQYDLSKRNYRTMKDRFPIKPEFLMENVA